MSTTSQSNLHDDFVEYHSTRDVSLRNALVNAYRPLAYGLVRRQSSNRTSPEDLLQSAFLALISAVERFDPHRDIAFTTFAWTTMQGALKRHHRDQTWMVRPPRGLQERFMETSAAIEELTGEIGASPTVRQVAVRLRLADEDVIEALEVRNAYSPGYLDAPVGPDEEAGPGLPQVEPGYAAVDDEVTLSPLVARLPAAEREMVRLRFVEQMTQSQIGAVLGVSQMQVSRVLAGVLAKLRTWMNEAIDG